MSDPIRGKDFKRGFGAPKLLRGGLSWNPARPVCVAVAVRPAS